VIEITVELLDTPTNMVGLTFTNTADYTYNQIADTPDSQAAGLPGTTAPMQIVGLNAQKTVAIDLDQNANGLLDPGDVLIYTITVTNPSVVPATGVVLIDDVPADTTYVANSVTLNGLPVGQPDGGISPLIAGVALNSSGSEAGTLAAGSSAVVTFKVQVNPGVPAGTVISNQGYVTGNGQPTEPTDADGDRSNGHQPTTIVVGSDQQVMITKEVSVVGGGAVEAGAELEYIVRVTNTGVTPATNLVITDDLALLAGQASYVAGSATLNGDTAGVSYAAPVLTADYAAADGYLLPGTTATLRFRVLIDSALTAATTLTNTAQMAWNTPTLTATASVSVDVGGSIGSAMLSGHVWHDANLDKLHDLNEKSMEGWTVALYRNDLFLRSVSTDAEGRYSISGLEPTFTTAWRYELRFTAPGAGARTAKLGVADSIFTNGLQRISEIVAASGSNLQDLNLPLAPNGTVYDSVRRTAIAGATLTLTGVDRSLLPSSCFDDPAQQEQVTPATGHYRFDLNFGDPSCPAGGEYLIQVTVPASGFAAAPSQIIPPQEGPYDVAACPADAVPSTDYCEIQASELPPGFAAATHYYLHMTLSNGHVPQESQLFNNHIPIDPVLDGAVAVTKTTPLVNVRRGDLVPYTITVRNTFGTGLQGLAVVDTLPPGFKYVAGSGRLDGEGREPISNGRQVIWEGIELLATQSRTFTLLLAVGAGVSEGEYVNRAQMINSATGGSVSGEDTATVRVVPDPTLDCTEITGKVFDDANLNGYQDEGEKGLPGVRIVSARGLIVTTDAHGRFHIACAAIPNEDRGGNFILKLDDRTLPSGYRLTTENPRVQRVTRGKAVKFNFGATIHRVVGLDIADGIFEEGSTEIRPQWRPRLSMLMTELQKSPAVLRLSYLADVEEPKLVQNRVEAVKKAIAASWDKMNCCYKLTIETEVFWRRGGPPDRSGIR
jgi:large repetitive protein